MWGELGDDGSRTNNNLGAQSDVGGVSMKCFGSSEQKHIFPACRGGGAEGYKRLD